MPNQRFRQLFDEHHGPAVRYAQHTYMLDYDTADQIVTDAFLCLNEALSLGEQIEHVNAWLRHNIHARHIDWLRNNCHIRRQRQLKRVTFHDDIACVEHPEFDQIDCEEAVKLALKTLSPRDRKIVNYALVRGYSNKKTAKKLKVAERTVERRLSFVRRKLGGVHSPLRVFCPLT